MTTTWTDVIRGTSWLHSPRLLPWQLKAVTEMKRRTKRMPKDGTLWILSSGTQSANEVKAIALRQEALLASADAVNKYLSATANDHWLVALPLFHVGGLSILARAFLSGSAVSFQPQWNARSFVNEVRTKKCTLCSLVPTQVHDLVISGLTAPESLRAVVVGGGALEPKLYFQARALGWPLLPSYGLTECSSQVATASLGSLQSMDVYPALHILPHVELEIRESRIFLRSVSCAHLVARCKRDGVFMLEDPWRRGWLPTEDLGEVEHGHLRLLGRGDDVVKVLGELVPLVQVEHEARRFLTERGLTGDLTILAVAGEREGQRLILVTDSGDSLRDWSLGMNELNDRLPGPMRLKQLCWVVKIPRGELGKVKKAELRAWIGV